MKAYQKTVFISHSNEFTKFLHREYGWRLIQNQQQLNKTDLRSFDRIIIQADIDWDDRRLVDFHGLDLVHEIVIELGLQEKEIILASTTDMNTIHQFSPHRFRQAFVQLSSTCKTTDLGEINGASQGDRNFFEALDIFTTYLLKPHNRHDESVLDLLEWSKTEFSNVKENEGWVENDSFEFFQGKLLPRLRALKKLLHLLEQNQSIPKGVLLGTHPSLSPLMNSKAEILQLITKLFSQNDLCKDTINGDRHLLTKVCQEAKIQLNEIQDRLREVIYHSTPKIPIVA